jgi:hypothetical protein
MNEALEIMRMERSENPGGQSVKSRVTLRFTRATKNSAMVGTYSCYNCLNPVPANTLVCPHCGEVQRRGARPHDRKYYIAIILSAIVLIGWNWYGGGQKTQAVTSPPSAGVPSR